MVGMRQWECGALRDQLLSKMKSDVCCSMDTISLPLSGKVGQLGDSEAFGQFQMNGKHPTADPQSICVRTFDAVGFHEDVQDARKLPHFNMETKSASTSSSSGSRKTQQSECDDESYDVSRKVESDEVCCSQPVLKNTTFEQIAETDKLLTEMSPVDKVKTPLLKKTIHRDSIENLVFHSGKKTSLKNRSPLDYSRPLSKYPKLPDGLEETKLPSSLNSFDEAKTDVKNPVCDIIKKMTNVRTRCVNKVPCGTLWIKSSPSNPTSSASSEGITVDPTKPTSLNFGISNVLIKQRSNNESLRFSWVKPLKLPAFTSSSEETTSSSWSTKEMTSATVCSSDKQIVALEKPLKGDCTWQIKSETRKTLAVPSPNEISTTTLHSKCEKMENDIPLRSIAFLNSLHINRSSTSSSDETPTSYGHIQPLVVKSVCNVNEDYATYGINKFLESNKTTFKADFPEMSKISVLKNIAKSSDREKHQNVQYAGAEKVSTATQVSLQQTLASDTLSTSTSSSEEIAALFLPFAHGSKDIVFNKNADLDLTKITLAKTVPDLKSESRTYCGTSRHALKQGNRKKQGFASIKPSRENSAVLSRPVLNCGEHAKIAHNSRIKSTSCQIKVLRRKSETTNALPICNPTCSTNILGERERNEELRLPYKSRISSNSKQMEVVPRHPSIPGRSLGPTFTIAAKKPWNAMVEQKRAETSAESKNTQPVHIETSETAEEVATRKLVWQRVMDELVFKVKLKNKNCKTLHNKDDIRNDRKEVERSFIKCNDELMFAEVLCYDRQILRKLQLCPLLNNTSRGQVETISFEDATHTRHKNRYTERKEPAQETPPRIDMIANRAGQDDRSKGDWHIEIAAQNKCLHSERELGCRLGNVIVYGKDKLDSGTLSIKVGNFKIETVSSNDSGDHGPLLLDWGFEVISFSSQRTFLFMLQQGRNSVRTNSISNFDPPLPNSHVDMIYAVFWIRLVASAYKLLQHDCKDASGSKQQSQGPPSQPSRESTNGTMGMKSTPSPNQHANTNNDIPSRPSSQSTWASTLFSWFYKQDNQPQRSSRQKFGTSETYNEIVKATDLHQNPSPDAKDKISLASPVCLRSSSRRSNVQPEDTVKLKERQDVGTSPRWMLVSPVKSIGSNSLTNDMGCSPIQDIPPVQSKEKSSNRPHLMNKTECPGFSTVTGCTNSTTACCSPLANRVLPKAKRIHWSLACKGVPLVGIALAPCENKCTESEDLNMNFSYLSPIESDYNTPVPLTGLARSPMPEVLHSSSAFQASMSDVSGHRTSNTQDFDTRTVILGTRTPSSEVYCIQTPRADIITTRNTKHEYFPAYKPIKGEQIPSTFDALCQQASGVEQSPSPKKQEMSIHSFEDQVGHSNNYSKQSSNKGQQQSFNTSGDWNRSANINRRGNGDKWNGKVRGNMQLPDSVKGTFRAKTQINDCCNSESTTTRTQPISEDGKNPFGIHALPHEISHYCPPVLNPNLVRSSDPPPMPTGGVLEYHPAQEAPQDSYCTAAELRQQQMLLMRNRPLISQKGCESDVYGHNEELHGGTDPSYHCHIPDYRQSGFRPITSKESKMLRVGHSYVEQTTKPSFTPHEQQKRETAPSELNHQCCQFQQTHSTITSPSDFAQRHAQHKNMESFSKNAQSSHLQQAQSPLPPPSPPPMPSLLTKPPIITTRPTATQRTQLSVQLQNIFAMHHHSNPVCYESREASQKRACHHFHNQGQNGSSFQKDEPSSSCKVTPEKSKLPHCQKSEMNRSLETKHNRNSNIQTQCRKQHCCVQEEMGHGDRRKCHPQQSHKTTYHGNGKMHNVYISESDTSAVGGRCAKTAEKFSSAPRSKPNSLQPVREGYSRKYVAPQTHLDAHGHGDEHKNHLHEGQKKADADILRYSKCYNKYGSVPPRPAEKRMSNETVCVKEVSKQNHRGTPSPSTSESGYEYDDDDDEEYMSSSRSSLLQPSNASKYNKNRSTSGQLLASKHSKHLSKSCKYGQSPRSNVPCKSSPHSRKKMAAESPRSNIHRKISPSSKKKSGVASKLSHQPSSPRMPVHQSGRHRFYRKESADLVKECIQSQSGIWYRSNDVYGRPSRSEIAAMVEKTLKSMLQNYAMPEYTVCKSPNHRNTGNSAAHLRSKERCPKQKPVHGGSGTESTLKQKQRTVLGETMPGKKYTSVDHQPGQCKPHYQNKEVQHRVRTPFLKPSGSEPQIPSPDCKNIALEPRSRSIAGFNKDCSLQTESATSSERTKEDEDETEEEEEDSGRTLSASCIDNTEAEEATERSCSTRRMFRPIPGPREHSEEIDTEQESMEDTRRDSRYSQEELEKILKLDFSQLRDSHRDGSSCYIASKTYTDTSNTSESTGFSC